MQKYAIQHHNEYKFGYRSDRIHGPYDNLDQAQEALRKIVTSYNSGLLTIDPCDNGDDLRAGYAFEDLEKAKYKDLSLADKVWMKIVPMSQETSWQ